MRLLSLCWLVVLFCSHGLAAAAGRPVELLGTPKALANETSKSTGVTTDRASITNDRLTTASEPPPAFSRRKQGEASQMVEPKEQKTSPKSQPASSGMLQGTRIARVTDHKAADAVTEFFRQEGTQRFDVRESEKQIRIADVIRNSDFPEHRIVTVDQYVQDVPVFGSRTAVEVVLDKKGVASVKKVKGQPSVSGRLVSQDRLVNLNTIPDVSWTEAIDRALGVYRQERPSSNTSKINSGRCAVKVQLTILDPTIVRWADKTRLAWYVRVDGVVVFIDAQDGSSIFHYDNRPSAFQVKIYDVDGGGQAQCETVNPVLDENGPYPGAPSVSDDPPTPSNALRAKEAAKKAYDFFKKLGWNSYNNQGSAIQSCVRVEKDNWGSRFGQWDVNFDFHCIYFYPGLPDAEDIAGHEFTHGVIQYMPTLIPNPTNPDGGLLLENESGALAEALADFFGSQIEGPKPNWTIGEKLTCEEFFDKDFYCGTPNNTLPLRNMADPHKGSSSTDQCTYPPEAREPGFYPNCSPGIGWNQGQPDHYAELVNIGQDICKYIGVGGDRGCIHLNSGILNKAMYLAANGGDHHSVPVHGIGKKKLTRIVFWTLRNKELSTAMGMKAFAETSHEACTELSAKKKYQILHADCNQVKNAFVAVGLMSP
jgi:Zn-dependent metalloprotease